MPILKPKQPVSEPSVESKQNKTANKLRTSARRLMKNIVSQHDQILKLVWQNEEGLTPQQVFDAFGEEAGDALTLSRNLVDFVNAQVPGTIDVSGLPTLTTNPDGTVTVG